MSETRILLEGLEVHCLIGVHGREQLNTQPLLVNIEVVLDASKAAALDDLSQPRNYDNLATEITFNGGGDTMTPAKINFLAFWIIQLPLGYWLSEHVLRSLDGVFITIFIGESLMTLIAFSIFRRGQW